MSRSQTTSPVRPRPSARVYLHLGGLFLLVMAVAIGGLVRASPGGGAETPSTGSHRGGGRSENPLPEGKLKAAFLLKFADFVTWPEGEPATPPLPEPGVSVSGAGAQPTPAVPLRIGIHGPDPFAGILGDTAAAGTTLFVVVRIPPEVPEVTGFQIIYCGDPEARATAHLLDRVGGQPVLTVGEGEFFLEKGGIIAFTTVNNRIRFLISLRNARRAGLTISSKLLGLALKVVQ